MVVQIDTGLGKLVLLDPDQLLTHNSLILFDHELYLLNEEDELANGFINEQQLLHVPLLLILFHIVNHRQMRQTLILDQPVLQHGLDLEYVLGGLGLLSHQILGLLLQILHQFFMLLIHVNTSNGASLLGEANDEGRLVQLIAVCILSIQGEEGLALVHLILGYLVQLLQTLLQ